MFYVRWKTGAERRMKVLPPLQSTHPAYTLECLYCGHCLGGGFGGSVIPEPVQLVAVAPIDLDAEDRAKFAKGGYASVGAALLHARCVRQMDDEQLEKFIGELVPTPSPMPRETVVVPGENPDS